MEKRMNRPDPMKQRGQALLWLLAMSAACCAVFALVYNVGQVTNEKEKTINAADAAALSASLVEARMLNFEAYTNRAMIANEVTIAQLVSLDSWVRYDNKLAYWISMYTKPFPYLNAVTASIASFTQGAVALVDPLVQVGITGAEVANTALWLARENANDLGAVAANQIAGEIANANQTTFNGRFDTKPELNGSAEALALVLNETAWAKFTTANTGDDRKDARKVILDSRDQFSTYRGAGKLVDRLDALLSLPKYALLPYTQLVKTSGGTDLAGYDHWQAQDSMDATLSIWGCKISWFSFKCRWSTHYVPVPIGYGRADADSDGRTGANMCPVNTLNCNLAVRDRPKVLSWQGPTTVPRENGIPNIRDLADRLAGDDCSRENGSDGPGLAYLVAVQKSADATLTTQRIGNPGMNTVDVPGPQGSPRLTDNLQNGDKLTSLSKACTFFLRPDRNVKDKTQASLARHDGVHEYASLYNPYWQARLTSVDGPMKALLYGALRLDPLLAPITP
jgi:hypothetical protein